MCSRPPQNGKLGSFTPYSCNNCKKRDRAQRCCFANLNLLLFCSSGCRRSLRCLISLLGSLSKDVFEGRTSTGSEPFSLFICLDANKFVLLSFFSLMRRIYPRVSNKPLPNNAKGPLPVDVRRSTTLLLKLPNGGASTQATIH